jgi:hypothetical protein
MTAKLLWLEVTTRETFTVIVSYSKYNDLCGNVSIIRKLKKCYFIYPGSKVLEKLTLYMEIQK